MTQFHAHVNLDPDTRDVAPYVLDVQSRLLDGLATNMVAPLVPLRKAAAGRIARLNPVVVVGGKDHVMVTQSLFAMPSALLGRSGADCRSHQHHIVAAIDCLLSGV